MTPAAADLNAGKTVTLTLSVSEAVTVTGGAPTLSLNDGGTATYDPVNSTPMSLVFDYTVAAGQNIASLAATGVNLNNATVSDGAGNLANLSLTGLTQSGPQIDTTPPAVLIALALPSVGQSMPADPMLSGSADPNAVVTLSEAGTIIGTTTSNASGVWTFTPSSLPQGAQTIVASDTDGAGNIGTASLSFTLRTVALSNGQTEILATNASGGSRMLSTRASPARNIPQPIRFTAQQHAGG